MLSLGERNNAVREIERKKRSSDVGKEIDYGDRLVQRRGCLTPGTADRKPGAAFGTKGVTGLRIRCCHLLTLLPDLVTIIYVRGEVLGKNWPKIAGDFRKVNITFRLDVYCRYM